MKECDFHTFQDKVMKLSLLLIKDNPFLRLGQAIFIVMSNKCKRIIIDILAEVARDDDKNPFCSDDNIIRFWDYLRERLNVK